MKVITAYPVYVNKIRVAGEQDWLYFDSAGKPTNKAETKVFQDWLDANKAGWVSTGTLNKGSGYGKFPFGPATQAAWNNYGQEFAISKGLIAAPTSSTTSVAPSVVPPVVPPGATPTVTLLAEAKKKGWTWDALAGGFVKAKESGLLDTVLGLFGKGTTTSPVSTAPGFPVAVEPEKPKMSKGVKIALIGGGVLVLGVLIFALTRKK